ncbi:hypothetical protein BS78_05G140100 [Paspalum vaginatum]|nr:hypothetical protein BS78_05G140100 [Paspalum vaginatum]
MPCTPILGPYFFLRSLFLHPHGLYQIGALAPRLPSAEVVFLLDEPPWKSEPRTSGTCCADLRGVVWTVKETSAGGKQQVRSP